MTAQTAGRGPREKNIKRLFMVLATGVTVQPGSAIFWDTAAGKVTNAVTSTVPLVFLGTFTGNVQNNPTGKFLGDGATKIEVDLVEEILLTYFVNGTGGDLIAATDLLKPAYALDDQTASILSAGKPRLGVIWDVSNGRVGVQKTNSQISPSAASPALPAFAANAIAQASVQNGAEYDVPATAGASTITLPAAAPDGTIVEYSADGTKNAHTVQYVDATGPVNITTALTASKRHLVRCVKLAGTWRANAYVSP